VYQSRGLNLWYGDTHALKDIHMDICNQEITAIIGPSGCGKSTYLKTLNRMVEQATNVKIKGEVHYRNQPIFDSALKVEHLRTNVGMVFQKANPFPKSIYENIAYGPKIYGIRKKVVLDEIVETSLRKAFIWDEVKDRLHDDAYRLSGGQQQRLCIARCLAIEPEVILMDEPTSALDPKSTLKIEELITNLKDEYAIVIVTHNMQQAARISDKTAFFYEGEILEYGEKKQIFEVPQDKRTYAYSNGQFG